MGDRWAVWPKRRSKGPQQETNQGCDRASVFYQKPHRTHLISMVIETQWSHRIPLQYSEAPRAKPGMCSCRVVALSKADLEQILLICNKSL